MLKKANINTVNHIFNLITYFTTLLISFFLTPYITQTIGTDAYGFVSLSNTFVNYFSIITIAFNSMASRFISIEYHKGNIDKAKKYYNSVIYTNILISILIIFAQFLVVINIHKILEIPNEVYNDFISLLWLSLISFIFSINASIYNVSVFIKNKLFMQSIQNALMTVIKGVIIIFGFMILGNKLSVIGIASLVVSILGFIYSYFISRLLTPDLSFTNSKRNLVYIKDIFGSGIWNSIVRLGNVLLEGIDLLIANIYVGPVLMGVLAISKTLPAIYVTFIFSISNIYLPELVRHYANKNQIEMTKVLDTSSKVLSIFTALPFVVVSSVGLYFYKLWLPEQDSQLLLILSLIAMGNLAVNGCTSMIYTAFPVTNQLKPQAMMILFSGVISTLIVLLSLRYTKNPLFLIAGTSIFVTLIRDLFIFLPKAVKIYKLRLIIYVNLVIKNIIATSILSTVFFSLYRLFDISNWFELGVAIMFTIVLSLIVYIVLYFSKEAKNIIIKIFFKSCKNNLL